MLVRLAIIYRPSARTTPPGRAMFDAALWYRALNPVTGLYVWGTQAFPA